MSTVVLLSTFLTTKKLALSISVDFQKNSLIVAYCTFSRFKFRTLTSSRFRNQTNDTFKPLYHNWNHQQGFLKQKIVTLHCCGVNLKFPKHLFWWLFWVSTINETIVTEKCIKWLCATVALLQSFYFTLKSALSSARFFWWKFPNYDLLYSCNLEIKTLKANRFKNQSIDTVKLLDQNCNHQQGFFKEKTVALHHHVLS